ncbi:peptidase U32 family protein [Desulfogranum mediterraneum]|uniref:peptidase U32 family protein n=1 Tax=Desulfogranum mediterraneum TaxID=160661 RepID=UPI000403D206|nr:peptidase U32 family protein [Desulfogranum mediterraneum]
MHVSPLSASTSSLELLAPVGTLPAFEGALEEGADAVYVGAPGFNARDLRKEFSMAELAAMTRSAHERGKRIYIAMNSLVKEQEQEQALEILSILAAIKPDALIIQDLGLFHLARTFFPTLPLHASTLMSVHNTTAARFLSRAGFERVVLARELSMAEIHAIGRESGARLEVFIHGAMCFSYSGLCLFSSMHGGKSSLRGQCVQPCRRRYNEQSARRGKGSGRTTANRAQKGGQKGGFLFSMSDLCGISFLEQLAAMGVVSLKIEGRLKSVEYVRKTVRAYRLCLDHLGAPAQLRKEVEQEASLLLDQAMGRRRTPGFFSDNHGGIIKPRQSGVAGIFLGKARPVKKSGSGRVSSYQLTLQHGLKSGDRLRFQSEHGDVRESFTLQGLHHKNRPTSHAAAGQTVELEVSGSVSQGRKKAGPGLLFLVDVSGRRRRESGRSLVRVLPGMQPKPDRDQLSRVAAAMHWTTGSRPSASPGRSAASARGRKKSRQISRNRPQWWVRLSGLPAARQGYPVRPARVLVPLNHLTLEQLRRVGPRAARIFSQLIWMLPPVIHEQDQAWYQEAVAELLGAGLSSFQLGHLSQVLFFEDHLQKEDELQLFADYTVNVLNSSALVEGARQGLAGMLFSLETDRTTLQAALGSWKRWQREQPAALRNMEVGMYVYGRPPLFTARLEAPHLQAKKNIVSPKGEPYTLERTGGLTRVYGEQSLVLLGQVQEMMTMGVGYFVLDLSYPNLRRATLEVAGLLHGNAPPQELFTGNYEKGLS